MMNKVLFILVVAMSNLFSYMVDAEIYNAWQKDSNGQTILTSGLPIYQPSMMKIRNSIDPLKTAFIVMDPWKELGDECQEIIENRIIPLVILARDVGHQIIILTNNPAHSTFFAKIQDDLNSLVDGKQIYLIYHDYFSKNAFECAKAFSIWLHRRQINTLIYTGFASNQCVIGRPMGMMLMAHLGFKLHFVPEASLGVELPETMENNDLHSSISIYISMWSSGLIHLDELMEAMSKSL